MTTELVNKGNEWRNYLLIAIIGILFFIPYLGRVHLFDWDEINFAEAAREMIVTGDYFTVRVDYEPFHEKPPFFFWLQAASMHVFGINEFAARFPNAIVGIITLMILYSIGKKLFDFRFGILWVLAYMGSFLPHFYFRTGIIDPVFNLFMFLGIYFLSEYFYQVLYFEQAARYRHKCIILAGVAISLAVLTKGPVGFLLPSACWFIMWLIFRKRVKIPFRSFLIFVSISILPLILWYLLVLGSQSSNIIDQFITYQIRLLTTREAGHGGPIYYHFVVILLGCFPASAIMIRGFRKQADDSGYQSNFRQWMLILLAVVLVVFSIVETKIVHYSSLAYFPVTFLAAYAMYGIAYRKSGWKQTTTWLTVIIGLLWALLFIAIPLLLMNADMILPRVTDEFTRGILKANVRWYGFEYMIGLLYLAAIIAAIIFLHKGTFLKGFMTLFCSTAIVIFIFLPLVVPKVDTYMQGAPLEFYGSLKDCNCYVQPVGFKSYAHYFYAKRKPFQSPYIKKIHRDNYENWLLTGNIDKPAFFVSKNKNAKDYLQHPGVKYLYSKNGFVFLKRDVPMMHND